MLHGVSRERIGKRQDRLCVTLLPFFSLSFKLLLSDKKGDWRFVRVFFFFAYGLGMAPTLPVYSVGEEESNVELSYSMRLAGSMHA